MKSKSVKLLTVLVGTLALGEFASSIMIWQENYADALPMAAVVFGGLFATAFVLLRIGRVTAGAALAGLLCLFEVLEFPSWTRHGWWDWATDSAFAVVSLAGLAVACVVLLARVRSRAAA